MSFLFFLCLFWFSRCLFNFLTSVLSSYFVVRLTILFFSMLMYFAWGGGELFIIIPGWPLSLGGGVWEALWGEAQESAFAKLFSQEGE